MLVPSAINTAKPSADESSDELRGGIGEDLLGWAELREMTADQSKAVWIWTGC